MKTLNFEELSNIQAGMEGSGICKWTFYGVGVGISLLGLMATGGAAMVLVGYGAYMGGIGTYFCP